MRFGTVAIYVLCVTSFVSMPSAPPAYGQEETAEGPTEAVIERLPVVLRDPATYQIPLMLEPKKAMTLSSQVAGIVTGIVVKPGEKVRAQSEVLRLDTQDLQILLERAQAGLKAAQADQRAAQGDAAKEAATARIDIARADLRLAELRLEQAIRRAPFDAEVYRIHAVEGEYVTSGEPLLELADRSEVIAEVPVERSAVKAGDPLSVKIGEKTVEGTVAAVLPAPERFGPLRDLFLSIAAARVTIPNAAGEFHPGDTVYSDMIPRHPIIEVPTEALLNTDDGGRRVQVIREGYVRDVPVQLLGQVGETHIFVSGRFSEIDQVVHKSSVELVDGVWVQPMLQAAQPSQQGRPPQGRRPRSDF